MEKKKSNLAKNTMLLSIGTMMTKGLNFVMVPFYGRWLSTAEYGIFDLFCTYVTLLIPVLTMSSNDAIFRFSQDCDDTGHKAVYITNGFFVDCVGMLAATAVLVGIRLLTGWERAFPFWLLLLGELIARFQRGYLRAIKRLDIYSFCSFITAIGIAIFVTTFVKILNMGVTGIVCGYACGYLLGDAVIFFVTKFHRYLDFNKLNFGVIKEILIFSIPLIPNNLSWWVINVSDRSIINLFLGAAYNGIYAMSYKIPNLCNDLFCVFGVAWQEKATEMMDDKGRNQYYNEVFNNLVTTGLSIIIAITSVNFVLFQYIFSEKYYEGRLYAPLLSLAVFIASISLFIGGIQISFKHSNANGISTVIGAVVNVVVHLAMVRSFGLYAACISTLVSNLAVTVIRVYMVRNIVRFRINKRNFVYAAIFLYMACCVYVTNQLSWNLVNFGIASVVFLYANMPFVLSKLKKVR